MGHITGRLAWVDAKPVRITALAAAALAALWLWSDVRLSPKPLDRWTMSDRYPSGALRYLGARQHIEDRAHVQELLVRLGTQALDVTPAQLTPQLITRYYAIKRSGALRPHPRLRPHRVQRAESAGDRSAAREPPPVK